jgi:glutamate dehydrogenase/leucine dehydrogenase
MPTPSAGLLDDHHDHEQVLIVRDDASGMLAVIGVHSTALGPAVGGLRFQRYPSLSAAAVDAMRLSRAMTLKNSAAGLNLGGGKAVLVETGGPGTREEQLLAFARAINTLQGSYITAEDIGTTPADMDLLATETEWVMGRTPENGGYGDPSGPTARTVLGGIKEGARQRWGSTDLTGRSVAIVGIGKVGAILAELLVAEGATLQLADSRPERVEACVQRVGGQAGSVDDVLRAQVDVLAPCAIGEMIDVSTVPELRCEVIAGAANNPLLDDATAEALAARDVLFVPDFLANCGGMIQIGAEFSGGGAAEVDESVDRAAARLRDVLDQAAAEKRVPLFVARELAMERVRAASDGATASARA